MRRGRGPGAPHQRGSPLSETVSLIREFNSEANPTRPVRPSPLTRSGIQDMPLDILDRIRSFPLFQSAPESFLQAIGAHLRPQMHAARDYIITEGDDAKAMYWLVRGAVAVTSRDGESTYFELKPGSFFGEIGVLMSIPRTATIIARSKCLTVVLKKEDLSKELPNFPEVERAIREEATERLAILNNKKRESRVKTGASNANSANNTSGVPATSTVIRKKPPRTPPSRGEKRALQEDEDSEMSDASAAFKKRKSPSPGLVEAAANTALGSSSDVHIRQLLRELPLFSELPSDVLHFIGANAQHRMFAPFTDIIKQDTQGREVYFIIRGEVEVIDEREAQPKTNGITNAAGRTIKTGSQVKARLRQGQYFGEVASLALAPRRTATVRSISTVEALLIPDDVLTAFWTKCPADIKNQVEKTARERLNSTGENDVVMKDIAEPIDGLAIEDRIRSPKSKSSKPSSPSLPTVTIESGKSPSEDSASSGGWSPAPQSIDTDPYLNPDLDNVRSKSRRSSLAPVSPDTDGPHPDRWPGSPGSTGSRTKHASTPPDRTLTPKRPKAPVRRASSTSRGPFPDSVLDRMLSYLELHELMNLRLVSLHWAKRIKESPDVLRYLDLSQYNRKITDNALVHYIAPFVGDRPRVIDLDNCFHITDEGFAVLASTCGANVMVWKMKSVWDVSATAIHEMVKQARDLEAIDLSNCRKVNDALLMHVIGNVPIQLQQQGGHPHAQHANGRYAGRPQYGRAPSSGPGSPTAPTAQQQQQQAVVNGAGTVLGSQKLRRITLSYCKHVTDRSMAHIGHYARTRLEEIDLTRCTTITDHGFEAWGAHHFTRLTKLCLADCTYLTDNAIVFLTNAAPGLRYLDLSFCCALSDTATEVLALGCPYLTHLSMAFCGSAVSDSSLRSIGLHLLEMRHLSVRGCVRVTGAGVEAVVEGCHKLAAFDVSQCKNLVPWLDAGGMSRVRKGVKFKIVAGWWQ